MIRPSRAPLRRNTRCFAEVALAEAAAVALIEASATIPRLAALAERAG